MTAVLRRQSVLGTRYPHAGVATYDGLSDFFSVPSTPQTRLADDRWFAGPDVHVTDVADRAVVCDEALVRVWAHKHLLHQEGAAAKTARPAELRVGSYTKFGVGRKRVSRHEGRAGYGPAKLVRTDLTEAQHGWARRHEADGLVLIGGTGRAWDGLPITTRGTRSKEEDERHQESPRTIHASFVGTEHQRRINADRTPTESEGHGADACATAPDRFDQSLRYRTERPTRLPLQPP